MKALSIIVGIAAAGFAAGAIVFTSLFAIQPIGAVPDGVTLWVWRGEKMHFFESADGICLRATGSVSLLCRMSAMAAVVGDRGRIIARLPYIEQVYLWSTDGKTYER